MPPTNRIWSLRDVSNEGQGSSGVRDEAVARDKQVANRTNQTGSSMPGNGGQSNNNPWNTPYCQPASGDASASSTKGKTIHMCHIPNLPDADQCQRTLQQIQKEFQPIWQRRGYNILSVSEMCCCCDGLDHQPGRRSKLRKQPDNVLGYNMTRFGRKKSHTIHLRLRDPRDHTQLLSWEDVAGTMAHEMSHCMHGPHNDQFFKLMEQILEDHAVQTANSLMPSFARPVNAGVVSQRHANNNGTDTEQAEMPSSQFPNGNGQVLGGNKKGKSRLLDAGRALGGSNASRKLSPAALRQTIAKAAEGRRRQMDRIRRMMEKSKEPCVIELLDDDDDDQRQYVNRDVHPITRPQNSSQRNRSRKNDDKKRSALPIAQQQTRKKMDQRKDELDIIDLTSVTSPAGAKTNGRNNDVIDFTSEWSCQTCTFANKPLALMCEMCQTEKALF